jgi:hypothetical protein
MSADLNKPHGPRIAGFYEAHLRYILEVLATRVQTVIDANRYAEEHAQVRNRAGAANLNEAFSHLAALAQDAADLSYEEQRAQIVEFEDHLRRSMMESFELIAKQRLGRIKREGLWDTFQSKAAPLLARGKLEGAPSEEEIRELEYRVRYYLEEGRRRKVVTQHAMRWDEWVKGAEYLAKASSAAEELSRKIRQAVGAAQDYRRHQLAVTVGVISTIAAIAVIIVTLIAIH